MDCQSIVVGVGVGVVVVCSLFVVGCWLLVVRRLHIPFEKQLNFSCVPTDSHVMLDTSKAIWDVNFTSNLPGGCLVIHLPEVPDHGCSGYPLLDHLSHRDWSCDVAGEGAAWGAVGGCAAGRFTTGPGRGLGSSRMEFRPFHQCPVPCSAKLVGPQLNSFPSAQGVGICGQGNTDFVYFGYSTIHAFGVVATVERVLMQEGQMPRKGAVLMDHPGSSC